MYRDFAEVLKNSEAEDYILPTGLTVMSIIACSIFGRLHGKLNLLLFKSGSERYYVERAILLDELLKQKESTNDS